MFVNITADAQALGLNLSGMTVSRISQAYSTTNPATGQLDTMSELILMGDPTNLIASMGSNFSGNQANPHPGYDGNYRQNTARWSMQINTSSNPNSLGAQIDIDPWNPNWGLASLIGHGVDVLQGRFGRTDTNQASVARALERRGISVGQPCTGGQ